MVHLKRVFWPGVAGESSFDVYLLRTADLDRMQWVLRGAQNQLRRLRTHGGKHVHELTEQLEEALRLTDIREDALYHWQVVEGVLGELLPLFSSSHFALRVPQISREVAALAEQWQQVGAGADAGNTPHSKRSAAHSSQDFMLSFGYVTELSPPSSISEGQRQTRHTGTHSPLRLTPVLLH